MLEMIGAGFLLVMILMVALWIVYFFQRNATIVDLGWAASFILVSWSYMILGSGYLPRRLIITLMVTVWAGRLFYYLWERYDPKIEDPRYTELKDKLGSDQSGFKMFLMFIFQGLIAIILTMPFLLICSDRNTDWSPWEGWGFLIWLAGISGEALADRQLRAFKKNPANRGKVCDAGFWRWSRHPNYFFEFIIWIGYAVFAFTSVIGIFAFISPVIIYYLLNYVSGIPPTEAVALRSKGEAYKEYQRKTSAFFPWFPRDKSDT